MIPVCSHIHFHRKEKKLQQNSQIYYLKFLKIFSDLLYFLGIAQNSQKSYVLLFLENII